MATRTQDFEGVSAGAAPTGSNTLANGSTAVSTTIVAGTGTGAVVGTTTGGEVITGSVSAKVTATGTAQAFEAQNTGGGTQAGLSTKRRWYAAPTANINEQVIRNTGGRSLSISLLTNGKVKISTNSVDLYTTPAALTFPGVFTLAGCVDTGTAANTDGRVQFAIYAADGTTLVGGMTAPVEFTGLANVGAGAATATIQAGKTDAGALTAAWTEIMDSFIATDTYALPGVAASNVPPTITGPAPFNTTGPTANLTFQGNDTDGTISSFTCVHLSNTAVSTVTPTVGTGVVSNPGTANASVTFPVSGMTANAQYRYGATDTDNSGATSSQVVALVNVTSPTPAIRPDTTTTGYTVVGGGTVQQALAAGSPTTRNLQSAAPAAGSTGSIPIEPLPPGAVPVFFSVTGHASDANTPLTRTVQLYQGATKIAETSGTINPTTDTTIGRNTSTGETAAITDRAALTVKWVVS